MLSARHIHYGYLPQYENDIYISYARVDNATYAATEGWVDVFHKCLDVELNKHILTGAIKTWRNVRGDEGFFTATESAIKESGIFVALVPNGYVISEFCQKELKTFYNVPKRGVLGNYSRIFFIELQRIPSESWPKEIRNLAIKTYLFHGANEVRLDHLGALLVP